MEADAVEADEVDNLGDEEDDNAGFGGVAAGENEVGNTGSEHGSLEEVIFRKFNNGVGEAEEDAAELDDGEEVTFDVDDTEKDNKGVDCDPNGQPVTREDDGGGRGG